MTLFSALVLLLTGALLREVFEVVRGRFTRRANTCQAVSCGCNRFEHPQSYEEFGAEYDKFDV